MGACFDLPGKNENIRQLEEESAFPDFWKDASRAKELMARLSSLKDEVSKWENLYQEVQALDELAHEVENIVEVEPRVAPAAEVRPQLSLEEDIKNRFNELEAEFRSLEFFILFSDEHDESNAIVAIHAGTGGTEAQDWAAMLTRMYFRFCERHGFTSRLIDEHRGTEAGIKSTTFEVRGRYAYGWLKGEAGVHRLVRISPFDAEKMRHTSFALVEVLPELGEVEEVKIDPEDLRIDTFLSGGHGGQSVQTTYSAVRIVHVPTGITVSCQNERSQQQNKETAMKILRARLFKLAQEAKQKEKQKLRGEYKSAEWGNQIRSYVLHPYKMVKDHRTKHETADPVSVLDGKLDDFVEAYLKSRAKGV